ncbi:MAG: hypothetical protein PVI60_11630, partial [Desulfobacteraceae bacterium]
MRFAEYLKTGSEEPKRFESIIDMFRLALETLDFAKLRTCLSNTFRRCAPLHSHILQRQAPVYHH